MNQKERMLANLPYKAWMDGLSEERMENKKRIYRYNHLEPDRVAEKDKLIKDIPANMIAVGNPCKVLREITKDDRDYYFRDRKYGGESFRNGIGFS